MPHFLHPLMRTLTTINLSNPSHSETAKVFKDARQGGLTPVEASLLARVADYYGDGWGSSARNDWAQRLASANPKIGRVPPGKGGVAEPEDLSSDVRTVWMPAAEDAIQRAYLADMVRLAGRYDYKVVAQAHPSLDVATLAQDLMQATGLSFHELNNRLDVVHTSMSPSAWGEDNKILTTPEGVQKRISVLVPPDISDATLYRAQILTQDEGYHPYAPGSFQGAVDGREEGKAAAQLASRLGRASRTTKSYLEGGNVLPGTTSDGEPYAVVGRDSLVITACHLFETHAFSDSKISTTLDQLEATGSLSDGRVWQTARDLLDAESRLWGSLPWTTQAELIADAKRFLATQELAKGVIAKDLGIPRERLVFVHQPDFHVDMHIRPFGHGEVMVNHPRACLDLIDEALQDPTLTDWEAQELWEMRDNASWELQNKGHVYDEIVQELQSAGLLVTRAPGVFASGMRQANFMNGVPGTTADGTTYYMVNGSSIGSLERAFQRFAKAQGVDEVEFVAKQGGGPNSLSAGEQSLELSGALDCRQVDHSDQPHVGHDLLNDLMVG